MDALQIFNGKCSAGLILPDINWDLTCDEIKNVVVAQRMYEMNLSLADHPKHIRALAIVHIHTSGDAPIPGGLMK